MNADYIIHFEIGTGDFTQAINNTALFSEKEPNKWVATIGRFDNPPAESIKYNNWQGLKTKITCGIEDKATGFHAAGGECLWLLISDGKHYLVADTLGIDGLDSNTQKMLDSIKFK
jgi:hypothetical protein